ncbi:DUF3644 domain-containing protein [Rhizobium johnstonii]|uniref:DUF3644 domain-containing protein n=1 Tax=Rhizobium johnstonii TaxID=3019933 RepID=UPI003F96DF81
MAKNVVSLTPEEKRVVKALLARKWRNQDIQALINTGRKATVNGGRITGVKKDQVLQPATDQEVDFFLIRKKAYDGQTGLNQYEDERLVRAREAMILAVQVFNSAGLKFKTEVFTMLANVAWTYLMHEYYDQKGVNIVGADGRSLLLSQMVERHDCPLTEGVRQNLRAMKILRDKVEHLILGKADLTWLPIFQACCLNFDKVLCDLFGEQLTLSNDLSLALQFAKMNLEQLTTVSKYDLPQHIAAIDALITQGMTEEQLNNIEFQFRVIYTLDAASKSKAHIQFVLPTSAEGKEIHNVLSKKVAADELYPHKPGAVVKAVNGRSLTRFTTNTHQKIVRYFKVRPKAKSAQPANTDKEFCIYHPAHKDYTYSDAWIDKIAASIEDAATYSEINAVKL